MTQDFRERGFEKLLIFFPLSHYTRRLIELQWRISSQSDCIFLTVVGAVFPNNEEETRGKRDCFSVYRNYSDILSPLIIYRFLFPLLWFNPFHINNWSLGANQLTDYERFCSYKLDNNLMIDGLYFLSGFKYKLFSFPGTMISAYFDVWTNVRIRLQLLNCSFNHNISLIL